MTLRVSLVAEQLLQPIPGGIGTYTAALIRHLPQLGVEVEPVVAWHSRNALYEGGVSQARRLKAPRRLLYRRWQSSKRPGVPGALVHAASLAFPPHGPSPLIVTVHDVLWREFPDAYPDRGVRFHETMLSRLGEADLVIVPSHATAKALSEIDGLELLIRVVPLGTDMAEPTELQRDEILDALEIERPYVLWMGTVEPRKNPEGVVRGFVAAVESGVGYGEELSLYLAGPPGWWSGDLGEFLESKNMSGRVRRLGEQPVRNRAALYAGAEVFLFPSLGEGFGLPVLEAMACGCPVVTSNTSSLPEVAGAAALLCDPHDPASIGSALAALLRDSELRQDLRRIGRNRAVEFTWTRTVEKTLDCYHEVLSFQ